MVAGAFSGLAAVELSAEAVAEVAFLDLLFLFVVASAPAGAVPLAAALLAAELSVASAVLLFFERDFFVVAVSALVALFPDNSAVVVFLADELSAASAVLLVLEALFLVFAVELSDVPVLVEAFFLDLEVVVLAESAVASVVLCEASEAAAFFLVFFFVVALVSVWSVEPEDPDCCPARAVALPKISSAAPTSANTIPLLVLIFLSPSARVRIAAKHTTSYCVVAGSGGTRHAVRAFLAGMRASSRSSGRKSRLNGGGQTRRAKATNCASQETRRN